MKNLKLILISAILISSLSACSDDVEDKPIASEKFPMGNKYDRRRERGSLLQGGSWIFGDGGRSDKIGAGGEGMGGVNAYLWRATLDVMSFMPLQSADAVGGVVITDWYQDPQAPGERIKANILISSNELRADALKVKLFRQRNGKDAPRNAELERKLEDKILTRARELKIEGERI